MASEVVLRLGSLLPGVRCVLDLDLHLAQLEAHPLDDDFPGNLDHLFCLHGDIYVGRRLQKQVNIHAACPAVDTRTHLDNVG